MLTGCRWDLSGLVYEVIYFWFFQDGDVNAPELTPLKESWARQDSEGANQRPPNMAKTQLKF